MNSHSPRKNNSVHFTDLLITIHYHFNTVALSLISNSTQPGDTILSSNNNGHKVLISSMTGKGQEPLKKMGVGRRG